MIAHEDPIVLEQTNDTHSITLDPFPDYSPGVD
jgi:hypothetical protein